MDNSNSRRDRAQNSFRRRLTAFALGLLAALLAAGVALAQDGTPITVDVMSNRGGYTASGTFYTSAEFKAAMSGGPQYHKQAVPLSAASLGAMAKGAVKKGLPLVGWGLTLKSIIDGAGWAIDELQGQVLGGPLPQQEIAPGGTYYTDSVAGKIHANPGMACAYMQTGYGFPLERWFSNEQGTGGTCRYTVCQTCSPFDAAYHGPITNTGSSPLPVGYAPMPAPVTDAQLGNQIMLSPNGQQVINAVIIDPVTGQPLKYPELVSAMNTLRKALEAANGATPSPDVTPDGDYSDTEPAVPSEWPSFCGWASVVCDFIDWVKKDDSTQKELPETELQIDPDSWDSGVGEGACPAPISVPYEVMGQAGEFEFSWVPACDFATLLRPFLIVASMLGAAYILAGLRGTGDAK